jgi:hypothetical protein
LLALTAAAAAALGAGPVCAQALGAVGQVLQVRETSPQDVVVLRRSGAVQPARNYDWLMAGDRIQVKAATATATVFDIAAHRSVRITAADGARAVGGAAPGHVSQQADDFFAGFASLFNAPRRPIAVETQARGAEVSPPLVNDPLFPPGEQLAPRGQSGLAVVWRGASGEVALAKPGGAMVAKGSSGDFASIELATPPLTDEHYGLSIGAAALNWTVTTVDPATIPEPPWMAGQHSTSDAERVVRAAWILRDGPPKWRMFAASELAALSAGNYAADRLWHALKAGEFASASAAPAPAP